MTSTMDPRLPAMPDLLDPVRALDLLRAARHDLPGLVTTVRASEVQHVPGRRLVLRYAVDVATTGSDGHERTVVETWGALHGTSSPPTAARVLQHGSATVALWRYPHDPFLPGLPVATDPALLRALLDRLGVPEGALSIVPRAYRAGRRAVLQVGIAGDAAAEVFVKVVRPRHVRRMAAVHLAAADHVTVPRLRASADDHGLLVMDRLPGTNLRETLLSSGPLPDAGRVVAVQERLSLAPVDVGGVPRRPADPQTHADLLRTLRPERAPEIARIIAASAATAGHGRPGTVHGDLHDAQLHHGDDLPSGIGLLDLDGLGRGEVADDCAMMLAHLLTLARWAPAAATRITGFARTYLDAAAHLVDEEVVRRRAAATVIGMAAASFAAQEGDWTTEVDARLDLAVALAEDRPIAVLDPDEQSLT